ncbi:DUF4129 domain-containing protein [Bacteroides sp. 214]|uniref:DUF4129 domain-containing protein n=1 Tax=Bacteroides sp. 214 TaxID=2302935 RepID=UPI0013D2071D|nr:DUF4129 domain-containing protein [Bacteroides sp. 214]NDW12285.1 DUF4129 domain-containing protein [Bacteroides sp. 214]
MIQQGDTLIYNKEQLARWQTDPLYDYNRELVRPEVDIYELLTRWFWELLYKFFGSSFADKYSEPILIGVFIVVVLLVVWFIYRKRPELFMRTSSQKPLAYTIHEDSIYRVDFAEDIEKALASGDYKEAVRLLYLQTLKALDDKQIIDWQLHKTPTEYVYEVKQGKGRTVFQTMTRLFLQVRFGNFDADEPLFERMRLLQLDIEKEVAG